MSMIARMAFLSAVLSASVLQAQERALKKIVVETDTVRQVDRIAVMDDGGAARYTIEREHSFDVPRPAVHVFENGRLLLADGYSGVLELYDTLGALFVTMAMNGSVQPDHERIVSMDAGPLTAVLVVSEAEAPSVVMYYIRSDGVTDTRTVPGATHVSGVRLSSDALVAAVGTYSWDGPRVRHRLDFVKGKTTVSSLTHDFRGGEFAEGDTLFLVHGKASAVIVDIRTGARVSEIPIERGSKVMDVLWAQGSFYVAVAQEAGFADGRWKFSRLSVVQMMPGVGPKTVDVPFSGQFSGVELRKSRRDVGVEIDGILNDIRPFPQQQK